MPAVVLLVHSAGPQGPGEGSEPFAARLREQLGPGNEVLFPIMPGPEEPHYEPWSERLGEVIGGIGEPTVVVGHSLGGSVALKHLAGAGTREEIAGLILVATPLWGDSGWESEWALPEGWPNTKTELPPIFLFHSRDDEEVPFDHLERCARRLPGATAIALDGNGHLFERGDLTEILDTIRELSGDPSPG